MLELAFLMLGVFVYGIVWIIDIIAVTYINTRDAKRFRRPVTVNRNSRNCPSHNHIREMMSVTDTYYDFKDCDYFSFESQIKDYQDTQEYYDDRELQLDDDEWLENQDPEFYDEYADDLGSPNEYYEY